MAVSEIIEESLAHALKNLMKTKPINSISVKEITDECHISRHTFYNHFHDIYELLGWMYDREVIDGLTPLCTVETWKIAVRMVLDYTWTNKDICMNTFHSLGRDHLERFLYETYMQVLQAVVTEYCKDMDVEESYQTECVKFYADVLKGVFVSWLKQDMKETPKQMEDKIDHMLEGVIPFVLSKFAKEKHNSSVVL